MTPSFFLLDSNFVEREIAAQGESTKWKIAIGIHTKKAATYTRQHWQVLLQHLNHPRVVGFSEVGFDFTVPPQQWRDHENLFRDLGTRGRVLILHLRGSYENAGVHTIRAVCSGRSVLRISSPELLIATGLSALVQTFTNPNTSVTFTNSHIDTP